MSRRTRATPVLHNVGHEFVEVGGKDLRRVHVKPSSFPVEATVFEAEKKSQNLEGTLS